ncbi:aminodeoxychorismate synthase, component I [Sphingomonas glacialis]|uniref:Probable branched-chain-amino-acid aminotransferase n=1 Tax=Sphingomonas glacialis TaxID=658225 RepID=A0ABQ3LK30_9SPHN|nr:aminodeoxychorismate synthase component I [Sphingomonas glacialis]GHH18380.1 aminodeoxychorismate synthase, component I [Sphingomonas glacialis]
MVTRLSPPFVLLDDARDGGAPARLYRDPVRIVAAWTLAQIAPALAELRAARRDGLHAAGFLSYEAGAAFEPALAEPAESDMPLLWFGLFTDFAEIAREDVPGLLPDPAGAWIGAPESTIDKRHYDTQFAAVQALIAAGDLYQANLTHLGQIALLGDPRSAYARLRESARAGFGALIDTGAMAVLSLSPELFFALEGETLTCRPMKGTALRGATPAEDAAAARALADDPKQRAENLMIVDLMRNDLARVARAGSVAVPHLFEVERYPTVHQLVSTATAQIAPETDAIDVLAALFPCGSITGAPKIAAMQAIAEIEQGPRGLYTGAIGRFDADGDAMFNVAIRTLTLPHGASHARYGAGGGIVADSRAADEWDEARAKTAFMTRDPRPFDLIETMAFDPEHGILRLDRHLERLTASARAFGFAFDRHSARNELQAATFRLRAGRKVRLLLARSGAVAIEVAPLPAVRDAPLSVAVVPLPVTPADIRLRHKTSDRGFYDDARRAAGCDEVVFVRPDGRLTEGSFTTLFVPRGDTLVTPPLADGLLPGVLRADLVAQGQAIEGDLTEADLTQDFFVGNALRGLIRARRVVATNASAR